MNLRTNETAAQNKSQVPGALSGGGKFFMLLPALLLGGSVIGWVFMIRAAVNDPSAAIEPDYYKKASSIDAEKAILKKSTELGWRAEVESFRIENDQTALLVVRLEGSDKRPLTELEVSALAFANLRSGDRQSLALSPSAPGTYSARVSRPTKGLWEVRLIARGPGGEFHDTLRPELFLPGEKS